MIFALRKDYVTRAPGKKVECISTFFSKRALITSDRANRIASFFFWQIAWKLCSKKSDRSARKWRPTLIFPTYSSVCQLTNYKIFIFFNFTLGRQHSPNRGQPSPVKNYSPGHVNTTPYGQTVHRSSSRDSFYTPNSPMNVSLLPIFFPFTEILFLPRFLLILA